MEFLTGFILLFIGAMLVFGISVDIRKHGQMWHDPHPGGPVAKSAQVVIYVLVTCMILGGLYLMIPKPPELML